MSHFAGLSFPIYGLAADCYHPEARHVESAEKRVFATEITITDFAGCNATSVIVSARLLCGRAFRTVELCNFVCHRRHIPSTTADTNRRGFSLSLASTRRSIGLEHGVSGE